MPVTPTDFIRRAERAGTRQPRPAFRQPTPFADAVQLPNIIARQQSQAPPPIPQRGAPRPRPRVPSLSSPPASRIQAPSFDPNAGMDFIAQSQRQAAASLASLDTLFEQRKAMLREQFKLTETPEERANIHHLLNIINVQKTEGTKVIERVYGGAIENAAVRAEETRALGAEAGERTSEVFTTAAEDLTDLYGGLSEQFGGAMGAGSEPLSPVAEGAVADLQTQAASEQAFDERMFNLTADDISFLGEAMRPEMGAQVGALNRTATTASALSQFEHDRAVQQRIAQERMAYAGALQQLGGMFDQRRFGLEDQQIALGTTGAELSASNAFNAAQLGQQTALSQAQLNQQAAMARAEQQNAQSQLQYEDRLRQFEEQQQASALRQQPGVNSLQADLATILGIGPDVGASILGQQLFPQPDPFSQPVR